MFNLHAKKNKYMTLIKKQNYYNVKCFISNCQIIIGAGEKQEQSSYRHPNAHGIWGYKQPHATGKKQKQHSFPLSMESA